MSNSGFRGRGFGARGGRANGPPNAFNGPRFSHPNFNHPRPPLNRQPCSEKWQERPGRGTSFSPWQQNPNFSQRPVFRGNPQFRPGGRGRLPNGPNALRFSGPGRPPAPPFVVNRGRGSAKMRMPFPPEGQMQGHHAAPSQAPPPPGSEEERQQKIMETADRLKQKLSCITKEDEANFWEDDTSPAPPTRKENTSNKGIPELKHDPPELDLTFNDFRDIGRVDTDGPKLDNAECTGIMSEGEAEDFIQILEIPNVSENLNSSEVLLNEGHQEQQEYHGQGEVHKESETASNLDSINQDQIREQLFVPQAQDILHVDNFQDQETLHVDKLHDQNVSCTDNLCDQIVSYVDSSTNENVSYVDHYQNKDVLQDNELQVEETCELHKEVEGVSQTCVAEEETHQVSVQDTNTFKATKDQATTEALKRLQPSERQNKSQETTKDTQFDTLKEEAATFPNQNSKTGDNASHEQCSIPSNKNFEADRTASSKALPTSSNQPPERSHQFTNVSNFQPRNFTTAPRFPPRMPGPRCRWPAPQNENNAFPRGAPRLHNHNNRMPLRHMPPCPQVDTIPVFNPRAPPPSGNMGCTNLPVSSSNLPPGFNPNEPPPNLKTLPKPQTVLRNQTSAANAPQSTMKTLQPPPAFDPRGLPPRITSIPPPSAEGMKELPAFNPQQPPPKLPSQEEALQPPPAFDPRLSSQEKSNLIPHPPLNSTATSVMPMNVMESSISGFAIPPVATSFSQLPAIIPPPQNFIPAIPMSFPTVLPSVAPLQVISHELPSLPVPPVPPPPKESTGTNTVNDQPSLSMDDGLEDMQEAMEFAKVMNMPSKVEKKTETNVPLPSRIPVSSAEKASDETSNKTVDWSLSKKKALEDSTSNIKKGIAKLRLKARKEYEAQPTVENEKEGRNSTLEEDNTQDQDLSYEDSPLKERIIRPKVVFNLNSKLKRLTKQDSWHHPHGEDIKHRRQKTSEPTDVEYYEEGTSYNTKASKKLKSEKSVNPFLRKHYIEMSHLQPSNTVVPVSSVQKLQSSKRSAKKVEPPTTESSWKNKVISRFLKMSKNDIRNIINSSGPRKFDIAIKQLVKEKRSSLSLEMRNTENEKIKEYDREEFMNQLNAMLDPGAVIDITNLPTEFIQHLNEVLKLDMPSECNESAKTETNVTTNEDETPSTVFRRTEGNDRHIENIANNSSVKEESRREKRRSRRLKMHSTTDIVTNSHNNPAYTKAHDTIDEDRSTSINDQRFLSTDNILAIEPHSEATVHRRHQPLFNIADLDDLFSTVTNKSNSVDVYNAAKCTAEPVYGNTISRTPRVSASDLDDIFAAGIAKIRSAPRITEADGRARKSTSEDRAFRIEKCERWSRKQRDDVDAFRNLTKEEWEAKYGAPMTSDFSGVRRSSFNSCEESSKDDRSHHSQMHSASNSFTRNWSVSPVTRPTIASNAATYSAQHGTFEELYNRGQSTTDSNSDSSSSTSESSDERSPDVTKLLKVIKEKERIGKKRSLNQAIRDEVNAEIERKWKEKGKHKGRKYRKREKRKKDRKGKRKKERRRRKKRLSRSVTPNSDDQMEDPHKLLTEDEIKKEVTIKEEPHSEPEDIGAHSRNTITTTAVSTANIHVATSAAAVERKVQLEKQIISVTVSNTTQVQLQNIPTITPTAPLQLKTKAQLKQMPENTENISEKNETQKKPEISFNENNTSDAENTEQNAENTEQDAENTEQNAENTEPNAENTEPNAENTEQNAENTEQNAETANNGKNQMEIPENKDTEENEAETTTDALTLQNTSTELTTNVTKAETKTVNSGVIAIPSASVIDEKCTNSNDSTSNNNNTITSNILLETSPNTDTDSNTPVSNAESITGSTESKPRKIDIKAYKERLLRRKMQEQKSSKATVDLNKTNETSEKSVDVSMQKETSTGDTSNSQKKSQTKEGIIENEKPKETVNNQTQMSPIRSDQDTAFDTSTNSSPNANDTQKSTTHINSKTSVETAEEKSIEIKTKTNSKRKKSEETTAHGKKFKNIRSEGSKELKLKREKIANEEGTKKTSHKEAKHSGTTVTKQDSQKHASKTDKSKEVTSDTNHEQKESSKQEDLKQKKSDTSKTKSKKHSSHNSVKKCRHSIKKAVDSKENSGKETLSVMESVEESPLERVSIVAGADKENTSEKTSVISESIEHSETLEENEISSENVETSNKENIVEDTKEDLPLNTENDTIPKENITSQQITLIEPNDKLETDPETAENVYKDNLETEKNSHASTMVEGNEDNTESNQLMANVQDTEMKKDENETLDTIVPEYAVSEKVTESSESNEHFVGESKKSSSNEIDENLLQKTEENILNISEESMSKEITSSLSESPLAKVCSFENSAESNVIVKDVTLQNTEKDIEENTDVMEDVLSLDVDCTFDEDQYKEIDANYNHKKQERKTRGKNLDEDKKESNVENITNKIIEYDDLGTDNISSSDNWSNPFKDFTTDNLLPGICDKSDFVSTDIEDKDDPVNNTAMEDESRGLEACFKENLSWQDVDHNLEINSISKSHDGLSENETVNEVISDNTSSQKQISDSNNETIFVNVNDDNGNGNSNEDLHVSGKVCTHDEVVDKHHTFMDKCEIQKEDSPMLNDTECTLLHEEEEESSGGSRLPVITMGAGNADEFDEDGEPFIVLDEYIEEMDAQKSEEELHNESENWPANDASFVNEISEKLPSSMPDIPSSDLDPVDFNILTELPCKHEFDIITHTDEKEIVQETSAWENSSNDLIKPTESELLPSSEQLPIGNITYPDTSIDLQLESVQETSDSKTEEPTGNFVSVEDSTNQEETLPSNVTSETMPETSVASGESRESMDQQQIRESTESTDVPNVISSETSKQNTTDENDLRFNNEKLSVKDDTLPPKEVTPLPVETSKKLQVPTKAALKESSQNPLIVLNDACQKQTDDDKSRDVHLQENQKNMTENTENAVDKAELSTQNLSEQSNKSVISEQQNKSAVSSVHTTSSKISICRSLQQNPVVELEKLKHLDDLAEKKQRESQKAQIKVSTVTSSLKKAPKKKENSSLHKIRETPKMKQKHVKKSIIPQKKIKDVVSVSGKPNTKEAIMARMIEIDVEIHKLMTEKMTLYQMLQNDAFPETLENADLASESKADDTPVMRPRTPSALMSQLFQNAETNSAGSVQYKGSAEHTHPKTSDPKSDLSRSTKHKSKYENVKRKRNAPSYSSEDEEISQYSSNARSLTSKRRKRQKDEKTVRWEDVPEYESFSSQKMSVDRKQSDATKSTSKRFADSGSASRSKTMQEESTNFLTNERLAYNEPEKRKPATVSAKTSESDSSKNMPRSCTPAKEIDPAIELKIQSADLQTESENRNNSQDISDATNTPKDISDKTITENVELKDNQKSNNETDTTEQIDKEACKSKDQEPLSAEIVERNNDDDDDDGNETDSSNLEMKRGVTSKQKEPRRSSSRMLIYSDESTWESPSHTCIPEENEQQKSNTGLALLEETYKREMARKKEEKKKELEKFLESVNVLTSEEEELPLSTLYIKKLKQKRDLLDTLDKKTEKNTTLNDDSDSITWKHVMEVINAVAEDRVQELYNDGSERNTNSLTKVTTECADVCSMSNEEQLDVTEANETVIHSQTEDELKEPSLSPFTSPRDSEADVSSEFKGETVNIIASPNRSQIEAIMETLPSDDELTRQDFSLNEKLDDDENTGNETLSTVVDKGKEYTFQSFRENVSNNDNKSSTCSIAENTPIKQITEAKKDDVQLIEQSKEDVQVANTNVDEIDSGETAKPRVGVEPSETDVTDAGSSEPNDTLKCNLQGDASRNSLHDGIPQEENKQSSGLIPSKDQDEEVKTTSSKLESETEKTNHETDEVLNIEHKESTSLATDLQEKLEIEELTSSTKDAMNHSAEAPDAIKCISEDSNAKATTESLQKNKQPTQDSKVLHNQVTSVEIPSSVPDIESTDASKNEDATTARTLKRKRSEKNTAQPRKNSKQLEETQKRARFTETDLSLNSKTNTQEKNKERFGRTSLSTSSYDEESENVTSNGRRKRTSQKPQITRKRGRRKKHTLVEMMSCSVRLVDVKYTIKNPNILRKLEISSARSKKIQAGDAAKNIQRKDSTPSEEIQFLKGIGDSRTDNVQSQKPIRKSEDLARARRTNKEKEQPKPDVEIISTSIARPVPSTSGVPSQDDNPEIEIVEEKKPNAKSPSCDEQRPISHASETVGEKESPRTQYTVHKGPILDIKVFGNSFLAASEDGTIYRYCQLSNGILNIYKGHKSAVTCLYIYNADITKEWVYSGSLDGTLRCYNILSGTQIKDAADVGSPIQCMDQAWGVIFVGTKSGHVSRFQIKSGVIKGESIQFSDKSVLALKATNEGARRVLIVASRNQPITIRDAQSGLFLRTICGHRNHTVYSLMRDNNLIYCGTSSTSIPVFDFTTGEQIMQYDAGVGIVCMRLYRKLLFAGCYDGNIYIFDTRDRRLICSIPGPGNMLLSMEVVDNKIIAGSKDKRLQTWQVPKQVRAILQKTEL